MKALVWLMLAAAVLVWAGALLDLGAKPRVGAAREAESEPGEAPATSTKAASQSVREERAPERPAPTPLQRQEGVAQVGPAASSDSRSSATSKSVVAAAAGQATTSAHAPEQAIEKEGTGELGEGLLSPEFRELEQTYVHEPREGAWAIEQERRVHLLFRDQPMREQLVLAHCQQTLCRLVLQGNEPDLYERLLAVPGLAAETGLGPQAPYSLRSGQLVVYFKRSDERAAAPQR